MRPEIVVSSLPAPPIRTMLPLVSKATPVGASYVPGVTWIVSPFVASLMADCMVGYCEGTSKVSPNTVTGIKRKKEIIGTRIIIFDRTWDACSLEDLPLPHGRIAVQMIQ